MTSMEPMQENFVEMTTQVKKNMIPLLIWYIIRMDIALRINTNIQLIEGGKGQGSSK